MAEAAEAASAPVLEINGARATIRLNRPKHLNRLQSEDLGDLMKLFDRIEADPTIRVLVLTGTGRAFSAGYDLNSVADRATSATAQPSAGSAFEAVVDRLEHCHDVAFVADVTLDRKGVTAHRLDFGNQRLGEIRSTRLILDDHPVHRHAHHAIIAAREVDDREADASERP